MSYGENLSYQHTYTDFINRFELLSPYQLDHFCKMIHQHYQEAIAAREKNITFTQGDTKEIMIRSMQALQIDLAEQTLRDAEHNLQLVKSRVFPRLK